MSAGAADFRVPVIKRGKRILPKNVREAAANSEPVYRRKKGKRVISNDDEADTLIESFGSCIVNPQHEKDERRQREIELKEQQENQKKRRRKSSNESHDGVKEFHLTRAQASILSSVACCSEKPSPMVREEIRSPPSTTSAKRSTTPMYSSEKQSSLISASERQSPSLVVGSEKQSSLISASEKQSPSLVAGSEKQSSPTTTCAEKQSLPPVTSLEKQAPLSLAYSEKQDSFKACSEKSPASVAGCSEKQSSPLNPDDPHYFSKILQKNVINSSVEVDEDEDSGGEDSDDVIGDSGTSRRGTAFTSAYSEPMTASMSSKVLPNNVHDEKSKDTVRKNDSSKQRINTYGNMLNSDSSPTFSHVIASTPVAKIACDEMPPPRSGTARKPIKKNQSRRISFSDKLSFRSKTPDEDVENFPAERKSSSKIVQNNVSEAPAENESEVFLSYEINENHPEAIETRSKTISTRSSLVVDENEFKKIKAPSKLISTRSSSAVKETPSEISETRSKSNSTRSSSGVNEYQLKKYGTRSKSNSTRSSSGMNENQLEIVETSSKSIPTRSSSGVDEIQLEKIETRSKSSSTRSSTASSIKHFADTTSNCSESGCIRRKKRRISFESFLEPPEIFVPDPSKFTPGCRRSKRTRLAPVRPWTGEHLEYDRDANGNYCIKTVEKAIIKDPIMKKYGSIEYPTNAELAKRRKLHGGPKTRSKLNKTARNLSVHVVGDAEVLTQKSSSPVELFDSQAGKLKRFECVANKSSLVFVDKDDEPAAENDPVVYTKALEHESFSQGNIVIRPTETCREFASKTLTFYVIFGKLTVTFNKAVRSVQSGDHFFVPQGNKYSIKNLRGDEAKLTYCQIK